MRGLCLRKGRFRPKASSQRERIMGDKGLGKAAILATQLGFSVACPLVAFIAGGVWADNKLGTKPWLFFLGLVIGLLAAGAALYQIAVAQPNDRRDRAVKAAPDKIELGTPDAKSSQQRARMESDAEDEDDMQFGDYEP